ncbi:MAG: CPBP family intramembrane metalloprotease [Oscillospiraceae bacterium]|nr:CPBP family intramembrane metalloprotease [Oscillospiraceae bacterium]
MGKALKNIWKIIWVPLLFLGMQFTVGIAYSIVLMFSIGVRLALDSALSGEPVNTDILEDPEKLGELYIESMNMHVPTIISAVLTFFIVFLVFRKQWKLELFWKIGERKPWIDSSVIIMCFGLGISANLFISGFLTLLPITEPEQPFEMLLGDNLALMLISLAVCAAFLEEIIFRGIVQKRLFRMTNPVNAVVLQAFIFGVVHLSLYQGAYAFILGLLIGVVYYWYDSIWVPVTIHFAFNATSVMLYYIAGDTELNLMAFMIITGASLMIASGFITGLNGKRPRGSALNNNSMDIMNIKGGDNYDGDDSDNNNGDSNTFIG